VVTFAIDALFLFLQWAASWPDSPQCTHKAVLLQALELWLYFWQLKQRRGFGMYGSTGTFK